MENTNNRSLLNFGFILGASLILSFIIASVTFYNLRSEDYISSTGSAKQSVTSDKAKWTSSITRTSKASSIKEGYAKLDTDLKAVKTFLATSGIPETSVDISPVFMNEVYEQYQQSEKSYNLVQNITVQSEDVQQIGNLSKNTSALVGQGILFSTNAVEYYYSKLPEARVALLEEAVKDAKARVEKLANAGGKSVGAMKSATSGVVQVMSPNSIEVSDYGTYDTSSIEKEIMVTVRASFEIN